jgi:molybdopterin converting factor small subunit
LADTHHPSQTPINHQQVYSHMPLNISLPSILARLADGNRALPAAGDTVGEAVADLTRRFPSLSARLVDDAGQPYPFVTYYLNDEDIRFRGGFDASVRDGDELTIVSAVAGG